MEVGMTTTALAASPKRERQPGRIGKCALTLTASAVMAACSTAGPNVATAGSLGRLDLVGRHGGGVLAVYPKDGRSWVVGTPGQEYAVRVCNSTGGRVLAVVSVDGINVITGDTAAPAQSGYVLAPYECSEIEGWRKSMRETAAFYFTELPDAYAARTGRPDNIGVIGVALFQEKRPPVVWRGAPAKVAGESRAEAPAPPAARAQAEGGAANARDDAGTLAPRLAQAPLGTGHGRVEHSPTRMVRFERATEAPAETLAIHYDRRDNLVAMGVLPPPVVARVPNPFPAWPPRFVPDPPR
jgi:hypothetical protein